MADNIQEGNKTLRFGIVGTNFIVDTVLAAAALDSRFSATAIYSRTQETADAFAGKHNIPYTFTSLEEMAQSDLIDAVYIASPTAYHAKQSILFMENGKHVLCEKPMASNIHEVQAMIAASHKYGVTLMEAMRSTLTPNFKKVVDSLPEVGTIRRYFASYCQYSSRYDKLKAGIVENAFKPEFSNGAVMDLGVYTIYPMIVLFGKPLSIHASGLLLPTGVDGQGAVNFEYEGMNATVLYSKISDSLLPSEIQGESGIISLDRIDVISKAQFHKRKGDSYTLSIDTQKNEYYYEIAEFIDLVESGRRESFINSHANSLATIEVIDEIRRQIGVVFPADTDSKF
ncbi:Gfo/Idh/MocA family protein [Dysgonomonas macrotermitis]|uniref:Predicted dehydrogenase n=1 Tax=Dysgonomonas macrotermitis TaxID=1346286 RepID=A0A1M5FC77_9BACT|nr:Gfo/Idh/MocA family oxidoreductase [Dysgonomonas macrotermitis]SHF89145.1 Predicted dehydrogenase [Dysgonomonas macrotermitis]